MGLNWFRQDIGEITIRSDVAELNNISGDRFAHPVIGNSIMLLFKLGRRDGSVEYDRHVIAKELSGCIDGYAKHT
jgi:hypothetical protein